MEVFLSTRQLVRDKKNVFRSAAVSLERLKHKGKTKAYMAIVPREYKGGKPVVELVLQKVPPKTHLIFICDSLTIQGKSMLKKRGYTEIVDHDTVAFDKMSSGLVPKYSVLSNLQIVDFERATGFKRSDLPKMLATDPMSKFLGLRPGQVVVSNDDDVPRIIV